MEYTNNPDPFELGMACIVLIGYIVGKVWMYYRIEDTPNKRNTKKPNNKKGVIKRGNEWDG
jgi:hypothetical protein